MASLQSRIFRAVIKKIFMEQGLSIPEERARSLRNAEIHSPFPKDVRLERFTLGDMLCLSIRPPADDGAGVVLYLHGGGYVTGSIVASQIMCIPMARTLGMRVILPDYRLAPENRFPAALDDALEAYRWLIAQGYDPSRIVVSGDSAGGGLALATTLALRERGEPLPAAVLCLSPWADLAHAGASHETNLGSEVLLRKDMLALWASYYAGDDSLTNPLISPAYADYAGFPPLLIQVASGEILLDDSRAVADRARAAGADVELSLWDDMWHVWPALGNLIPESRLAFEEMARFLAARGIAAR